jgi:hypothetical protein
MPCRHVRAGQPAGGGARRPARGGRRAPAGGADSTEVRERANEQGIEVKDRGRVPADLVAWFKAATLTRAFAPGPHQGPGGSPPVWLAWM